MVRIDYGWKSKRHTIRRKLNIQREKRKEKELNFDSLRTITAIFPEFHTKLHKTNKLFRCQSILWANVCVNNVLNFKSVSNRIQLFTWVSSVVVWFLNRTHRPNSAEYVQSNIEIQSDENLFARHFDRRIFTTTTIFRQCEKFYSWLNYTSTNGIPVCNGVALHQCDVYISFSTLIDAKREPNIEITNYLSSFECNLLFKIPQMNFHSSIFIVCIYCAHFFCPIFTFCFSMILLIVNSFNAVLSLQFHFSRIFSTPTFKCGVCME